MSKKENAFLIKGNPFLIVLLPILYLSWWYYSDINIAGRTIATTPEIITYILIIYMVFVSGKKPFLPKKIKKIGRIVLLYGIIMFFLDVFLEGQSLGATIGGFRRLFYYPFLGLIMGHLLSKINSSMKIFERSLSTFFILLILISISNYFLNFSTHLEVRGLQFIMRFEGLLLLLIIMFSFDGKIIKKNDKLRYIKWFIVLLLIISTFSRGIYLIVVASLGLYLLLSRKTYLLKTYSVIAIVGILGYLLLANQLGARYKFDTMYTQVSDALKGNYGAPGEKANSVGLRYFRYLSAYEIGLEKPFFGHGIGYKPYGFEIYGKYDRIERGKTVHNYFLTLWMKFGLLGLSIMLIFIYKLQKRIRSIPVKVFFIAAFAYSFVDVMMASTYVAIISVFFIAGFFISHNHNANRIINEKSISNAFERYR